MTELHKQIKSVRQYLNKTQKEFGESLGVSRDVYANIENNRVEPSQTFVQLLCSKYNINPCWLHKGDGSMLIENDKTVVDSLSDEYGLDSLDRKIIECYLNLGALQRKVIKDYLRSLVDAVLSDENYDDYREGYLRENADIVAARSGHTEKISELQSLYDQRKDDGE